jgi:hypothetical protein
VSRLPFSGGVSSARQPGRVNFEQVFLAGLSHQQSGGAGSLLIMVAWPAVRFVTFFIGKTGWSAL